MAFRRRLGNLAGTLLQSRLRHNEAEQANERIMQRQMEIAMMQDVNLRQRQKEERDAAAEADFLKVLQGDPRAAGRFLQQNPEHPISQKLRVMQPSADEARTALAAEIGSAKDLAGLGGDESIHSRYHAMLGAPAHDEGEDISDLIAKRQAQEKSLKSALEGTKQAEAYGTGIGQGEAKHKMASVLLQDEIDAINAKAGPEAEAAGKKRGAEERAALAPDIRKGKAQLAGAEASAAAYGRLGAEFDPKIIAKKIDFEKQKAVQEAAAAGQKAVAVQAAEKAQTMKSLLPQLTELRKLGDEISSAYPPNIVRDSVRAAGEALGALPFGLGTLATRMQERAVGPDLAARRPGTDAITKVNTYLSLRGATALAMTNAVFGNKGQTTEADRRAAEEILGSVLMNSSQRKAHDAILEKLVEDAIGGRLPQGEGAVAAWYAQVKAGKTQEVQQPQLDPSIQELLGRGRK